MSAAKTLAWHREHGKPVPDLRQPKVCLTVEIEPGTSLTGLPASEQMLTLAKAVSICLTGLQSSFARDYCVRLPAGAAIESLRCLSKK